MTIQTAANVRELTDYFQSAGKQVRVERFEPAAEGSYPAVLLLHGADGLHYKGPLYRGIARELASHGYVVLLPHYFERTGEPYAWVHANPVNFLNWMQAIGDGLSYAGGRPNVDAERIGLIGFSLGAYLALAVASQDPRAAAVVECFGGLPDFFAQGVQRMPPVLILHGQADVLVSVQEAHKLERLLQEKGWPYEIKVYPGQGHTFTPDVLQDVVRRGLAFLDRYLKGGQRSGREAS